MSDLKEALLDARYIDMISLADFVVRDCGLPDMNADGTLAPQANEIAASLFRWAAGATEAHEADNLTVADDAPETDAEESE
jgi:hypothetical protein